MNDEEKMLAELEDATSEMEDILDEIDTESATLDELESAVAEIEDAVASVGRKSSGCSCGCKSRSVPIFPAGMGSKDCGTGAGGFQPGNTCGGEEGSTSEAQNRVRESARSTAERVLGGYEISTDDSDAIFGEIDGGLFDDVSVDATSADEISSMSSSIEKRVDSFVQRAKGLIAKMKSTDPEAASRIIIETMVKSQDSIGISRIDSNTGSIEGDLAFAADAMLSTNLSNTMYRNPRSYALSFQSGGSAQERLDRVNALGSFNGDQIEIDSRDLPKDPKARSATIAHELAHANHVTDKPDRILTPVEKVIAEKDGMREYGHSSSFEYVAVFNEMLSQGHKFGSAAWSMYDQFDGPEHREDFRKSRTK